MTNIDPASGRPMSEKRKEAEAMEAERLARIAAKGDYVKSPDAEFLRELFVEELMTLFSSFLNEDPRAQVILSYMSKMRMAEISANQAARKIMGRYDNIK